MILALLLLACGGEAGGDNACEAICDELVTACGYAAYPDEASCLQGCAWDQKQGADVAAQQVCVEDAACDTFAIVECAHAAGGD